MSVRKYVVNTFLILFIFSLLPYEITGQDSTYADLSGKEKRKMKRIEFRKNEKQFSLNINRVFPTIRSRLSFELPSGLLSANLSLENNLGLADHQSFFSGSFKYRITPRSGIYVQYYGIERSKSRFTKQDYIFLRDTIPAGTGAYFYFNTQVLSAGYLFNVLDSPDAMLNFFFNIYFMGVRTGIRSDIGNIDKKLDVNLPLPTFGTMFIFNITPWFSLEGTVGFFSLNTRTLDGNIFTLLAAARFMPFDWMGISLNYEEFDVQARFSYSKINTIAEYDVRGPGIGLSFFF